MSDTFDNLLARDHRVTTDDAVACLVDVLPTLAKRRPAIWRDVQRLNRSGRMELRCGSEFETLILQLFKNPCASGLLGRVPRSRLQVPYSRLCWNAAVRHFWDAVDEHEVCQLVLGVWRDGTLGSVRRWQGNSALLLVHRALQVIEEAP